EGPSLLVNRARIVGDDRVAGNGIVHMIDRILELPDRLLGELDRRRDLSDFRLWLSRTPPVKSALDEKTGFTVFAPPGSTLSDSLTAIERRYLVHPYGQADLVQLMQAHVVPEVIYHQDLVDNPRIVSTLTGNQLALSLDPKSQMLLVNDTLVLTQDQLANNGVIHTLPGPIPPESLVFTTEKYLVGLNATRFVNLMRDNGLSDYLTVPQGDSPLTVLAPTNEAFDTYMDGLPAPGTWQLREFLLYHLLSAQYPLDTLPNGEFLASCLEPDEMAGRAQLVYATKDKQSDQGGAPSTYISFNHVTAGGQPVTFNQVTIYLLNSPLTPPTDLLQTVVRDLSYSNFLSVLYSSQLQYPIRNAKDVTYLVPSNQAFQNLDLALSYLLLAEAQDDLRTFMRSLVIQQAVYAYRLRNETELVCLHTLADTYVALAPV
ncbi:FAS1 domain-containing protein, partial [Dimargaris cristalligena]